MKKKILRLLLVLVCVVSIILTVIKICKVEEKLNTYLVLGDYLSTSGKIEDERVVSFSSLLGEYFIEEEMVSVVNDNYVSPRITTALLLEMINKEASSGKDEGLFSLIEDSKYITISVGMNDILDYIRFDSNKQEIVYDKEYIKRKLEMMKQNYYEIVEEIKNINGDAKVYLLSYYCPFSWVDYEYENQVNEVFELLNESVEDVCELTSASYVDISSVSNDDYMLNKTQIYLNQKGQEHVFTIIKNNWFEI